MPREKREEVILSSPSMILGIVSATFFFDQLTKFLITRFFIPYHSIPVVKRIIYITLVYNRGAAFGMLKNQVPLFIACACIAVILILKGLKQEAGKRLSLYTVSLSLILAGALGNLVDRIFWGYVIDFIDLRIWPVFNIADSAITIGAILLGYSILKSKIQKF